MTIREIRELVLQMVGNAIASAVQVTHFVGSSSLGNRDAVRGHPTFAGEPSYQYQVRRYQHYGFRSVPPKDVAAVKVSSSGGPTNQVTVAEESESYGPNDLAEGEVALYGKVAGKVVKLDASGVLHLGQNGGLVGTDGVVHGSGIDPFTGVSYYVLGSACANVRAKKT